MLLLQRVGLITAGQHRTPQDSTGQIDGDPKFGGAYDPRKGVVLLTHAGCPYICGYIWSGYAGTTTLSRRQLCISTS